MVANPMGIKQQNSKCSMIVHPDSMVSCGLDVSRMITTMAMPSFNGPAAIDVYSCWTWPLDASAAIAHQKCHF